MPTSAAVSSTWCSSNVVEVDDVDDVEDVDEEDVDDVDDDEVVVAAAAQVKPFSGTTTELSK